MLDMLRYQWSSATCSLTDLSPFLVVKVAWLTSGYWVVEWFPHMITFLISLTWIFNLSAIWPKALLWSSHVRHVMFFFGIEGANCFKMSALVFAGLATTNTCKINIMKMHQLRQWYRFQKCYFSLWKGLRIYS